MLSRRLHAPLHLWPLSTSVLRRMPGVAGYRVPIGGRQCRIVGRCLLKRRPRLSPCLDPGGFKPQASVSVRSLGEVGKLGQVGLLSRGGVLRPARLGSSVSPSAACSFGSLVPVRGSHGFIQAHLRRCGACAARTRRSVCMARREGIWTSSRPYRSRRKVSHASSVPETLVLRSGRRKPFPDTSSMALVPYFPKILSRTRRARWVSLGSE
ncbi:hypothetical protein C8N44_1841 [Allosediminivita pacifica]|uniref:Uncharacterized protein n=1 Tax=Allosediminivita pacifica TaxID=1267769 RepID=A0A2T5ZV66_9RHOB|nr:hypothetical protein C8N44_1841 [Allosediminivita pacifica]